MSHSGGEGLYEFASEVVYSKAISGSKVKFDFQNRVFQKVKFNF